MTVGSSAEQTTEKQSSAATENAQERHSKRNVQVQEVSFLPGNDNFWPYIYRERERERDRDAGH